MQGTLAMDHLVADLAERQHGVVSRGQLRDVGLSDSAIDRKINQGLLHTVYRGVFAVGHRLLSQRGRWIAAVLFCGEGAVLSGYSAAALWGLRGQRPGAIDVSVRDRGRHGCEGVRLHRPRRLEDDECTSHDRVPVTTVSRTLLDLAPSLSNRQLSRAAEEADRLGLLAIDEAWKVCHLHPWNAGVRKLSLTLATLHPPPDTHSPLEDLFAELCREQDLPTPAFNALIAGYEVDALWNEQRLIVELDSHEFHGTRMAFENDRNRDATLQLAGYRVIRLTHRRVTGEPQVVAALLRNLLEQPGADSRPAA